MRLRALGNGAVVWTGALVATATLAGFLDQASWLFEPASFFRLQYAVLLATVGLGALALRRPWLAGAAAVLVGVNVAVIAPWSRSPLVAAPGEPTIRVVAFNVDRANHRIEELGRLVQEVKPDVLGLTEVTPAWA
ncbi:MAG TPA: hypothetical protein VJ986_10505, partial [Gaiellaceae bacterium]|nr:hypothetical protein [Gaiellaceae bacterium]